MTRPIVSRDRTGRTCLSRHALYRGDLLTSPRHDWIRISHPSGGSASAVTPERPSGRPSRPQRRDIRWRRMPRAAQGPASETEVRSRWHSFRDPLAATIAAVAGVRSVAPLSFRLTAARASPRWIELSRSPARFRHPSRVSHSLCNWLARKDSNLQSPDPESGALPLGHSPASPGARPSLPCRRQIAQRLPCGGERVAYEFAWILAHVSFSVSVRLNTSASGRESLSGVK